MNRTVFISDLHLSENNHHLNDLFDIFIQETLLEKKTENTIDAVYILGDFFDIWLGDDLAGAWEKSIMEKLKQLTLSGIPVYFMQGNRDFLLEKKFLEAANLVFLSDPTHINLYGKKIVLKHGDDLCTEDRRYQVFRRFVRLSGVKWLYVNLPLVWRQQIVRHIRKKSQARGMRDIYAKVSLRLIEQLFRGNKDGNNAAGILIHGHTHCPQIEKINVDGQDHWHVILSDWNKRGNRLFFDADGNMALNYFE